MIKTKKGRYVDLEFEGKILVAQYKAGPKIDLSAAKEIVKDRVEFTNHNDVPVLVIDHGLVSMDRQAREFLSSDVGVEGIRASAIVSSSRVNSMLVNFILRISRPNLPVKMFTIRSEAVEWLSQYANEG